MVIQLPLNPKPWTCNPRYAVCFRLRIVPLPPFCAPHRSRGSIGPVGVFTFWSGFMRLFSGPEARGGMEGGAEGCSVSHKGCLNEGGGACCFPGLFGLNPDFRPPPPRPAPHRPDLMTLMDAECTPSAAFFGAMGAASALVFANLGAAYGTAKSGVGVAQLGIMAHQKIMPAPTPPIPPPSATSSDPSDPSDHSISVIFYLEPPISPLNFPLRPAVPPHWSRGIFCV